MESFQGMSDSSPLRSVVVPVLIGLLVLVWGFVLLGDRLIRIPSVAEVETRLVPGDPFLLSNGMRFVALPAGIVVLGSPEDEPGRNPDESPAGPRRVAPFSIMDSEVTVAQFREFVTSTGHVTDAEKEGFSWIYTGSWEKRPGFSWKTPGFSQEETEPVLHVSLHDAKAMALWMTETHPGRYRLPLEPEWEYAARAGTRTSRYWGETMDGASGFANVGDATARVVYPGWETMAEADGRVHTAPVRSYAPNGFGLYDMLGNVWEWVDGRYALDSYTRVAPERAVGGKPVVVRGGSWYSRPEFVRSASRDKMATPSRRGQDIGFRLVRDPD